MEPRLKLIMPLNKLQSKFADVCITEANTWQHNMFLCKTRDQP